MACLLLRVTSIQFIMKLCIAYAIKSIFMQLSVVLSCLLAAEMITNGITLSPERPHKDENAWRYVRYLQLLHCKSDTTKYKYKSGRVNVKTMEI